MKSDSPEKESTEEKTLSPLEACAAFAGMCGNAGKWARDVWRKNPQLKDFYRIKTLSQVDNALYTYDKWEEAREEYRNGSMTAYFYDKSSGKDIKKRIYANSKEELKKILLAEARSFEPDPDDHSRVMNKYFKDTGMDWMTRGLPTCWQDYDEVCRNPGYDGSLSWDEDKE